MFKKLKVLSLVFVCIVLTLFLVQSVSAAELDEQTSEYYGETIEKLEDLDGITNKDASGIGEITPGSILNYVVNSITGVITAPIKILIYILLILVGVKVISLFYSGDKDNQIFTLVATLMVVTITLSPIIDVVNNLIRNMKDAGIFINGFIPVFVSASVATGQITSASAYSVVILTAAQFFVTIISYIVIPLMTVNIAFGILASLDSGLSVGTAESGIKKIIGFILVGTTTVFIGLFAVQGIVGSVTDTATIKASKLVFSSAIPVVGSAISDALGSVVSCLQILKASAGVIGIGTLIVMFAPAIIEAGVYYFLISIASFFAEILDSEKISKLLKCISSVLGYVIAVQSCFLLVFIFSTTLIITMGGA